MARGLCRPSAVLRSRTRPRPHVFDSASPDKGWSSFSATRPLAAGSLARWSNPVSYFLRKENFIAKADTTVSDEETKPLRDILEGFLFYIGIPALTLYPLGFVALCLQMWRDR